MPRSRRVINPDGKGPRVFCRRCNNFVFAEQRPWPKSGYLAKHHEHTEQENVT